MQPVQPVQPVQLVQAVRAAQAVPVRSSYSSAAADYGDVLVLAAVPTLAVCTQPRVVRTPVFLCLVFFDCHFSHSFCSCRSYPSS